MAAHTFQGKIKGVFFEESTITLGTGHTQKTQKVKNYCRAEQNDDNIVKVTYLGNDGQPTGIRIEVPLDDFLGKYSLEPNYKAKTKEERETEKHIARAEKHRSRNEYHSAEWEYTSALKIDAESIRANFGIGTLYMEMGNKEKAKEVFNKLCKIEAIFEEENKHIFNEFGIELRKANMHDEALSNYMKAIEISPKDENLFFNISRLYYDNKDWDNALKWIGKAIEINPYFRDGKLFEVIICKAKDGIDTQNFEEKLDSETSAEGDVENPPAETATKTHQRPAG